MPLKVPPPAITLKSLHESLTRDGILPGISIGTYWTGIMMTTLEPILFKVGEVSGQSVSFRSHMNRRQI